MATRFLQVPVALLLDPAIAPAAKLIWIAGLIPGSYGTTELPANTGLSPNTVRQAGAVAASLRRTVAGSRVRIPTALLAEHSVGTQSKLLYGILQATPHFQGYRGLFTYPALSALTNLSRNTLKLALRDLGTAGWIELSQEHQHTPVHFRLGSPQWQRSHDEAELAQRRLRRASFGGEAIMKEYLSLLIPSINYTDNARPGFLVNPLSKELLELDRYYMPDLAFEFNGSQHETDQAQIIRDRLKAGICLYEGIHLVIIRAEDLRLDRMIEKVGRHRPLRDLTGQEPLIEVIEDASIRYLANRPKK